LIRLLLAHGDYVAAGLPPHEIEDEDRSAEFRELINECKSGRKDREGWKDRIRGIRCDGRVMGQCGAAVAEAVEVFGRIDILLCCTSEGSLHPSLFDSIAVIDIWIAVVGTVEELFTNAATQNLVRDQFEIIFFSQVNFIKATLPLLREKHTMYSASTWALEGYCDSLAYEIAPFNIKLTIVQPNKEISVLTNKIIFAPQLPQYESSNNPAPGLRDILTNVVNMHPETRINHPQRSKPSSRNKIVSRYPRLPSEARDRLVMETVHALTAIGGHENPPARHIVGYEGVASVKEKLKTVSEELEDFVEVSCAVDIFKSDVGRAALSGAKVDAHAIHPGAGPSS
jgi:NAD(P)-dependent dehydrogenase (short-subunit alcohol dehydrogenase family)